MLNLGNMHKKRGGAWYTNTAYEIDGASEEREYEEGFSIEDNSWYLKQRNRIIEAMINRYPPQDNTIIDVGGGNGYIAAYLGAKGFKTALFEPRIQGVKNAQTRMENNLVCAPLNSTTVKSGSVPAIGIFDVLEHIDDEGKFLNDLFLALKSGGMLYIAVPAHMYLWSDVDVASAHFRRYSLKGLREVLAENGFDVLYDTYFFRLLSLCIFAFRTLPYRLCGKKRANTKTAAKRGFVVPRLIGRIALCFYGGEIRKLRSSRISHGASIFVVARKQDSKLAD